MSKIIYLHGFASSPASRKAQWFRSRLAERGAEVVIPDLERGDFRNLTITGILGTLSEAAGGERAFLMGSSLGGYAAALFAAAHAEQVERLVLLAPAFGFASRWLEDLGPEVAGKWRKSGALTVTHYGLGGEAEIAWGFMEDAMRYPAEPAAPQPSLVFHGLRDTVVPIDAARRWCRGKASARLVEMDSDHELTDCLDAMWELARPFLFRE